MPVSRPTFSGLSRPRALSRPAARLGKVWGAGTVTRVAGTAALVALALYGTAAWAQGLPPGASIVDTIVDDFRAAVDAARPGLLAIARGTFGILAVIEIALSAILWTLREDGPYRVLTALVVKLAWLAFAFSLIVSFDVWFPPVINGFVAAGGTVAAGPVSPGDVLALGAQLAVEMVGAFFDGIGLLDVSVTVLVTAVLVAVAALLVLLMFAVIAAVVVLVLVESFIALAVGSLVLGFSAFRGTAGLADRFVAYVFNLGIRLFCLFLLVAIGMNVATAWVPLIAGSPDDLGAMLSVLGGSVTFTVLVTYVPFKVSSTLTGGLTVGFERAILSV